MHASRGKKCVCTLDDDQLLKQNAVSLPQFRAPDLLCMSDLLSHELFNPLHAAQPALKRAEVIELGDRKNRTLSSDTY